MSVTSTLRPNSTDASSDLNIFGGAASLHAGLSDLNDGTGGDHQLSSFDTVRFARGGMSDLPAGAGIVDQTVMSVRGFNDFDNATFMTGGEYPSARVSQNQTTVIATAASAALTVWTLASQVNALEFYVTVQFNSHDGVIASIAETFWDVTWEPVIVGTKGMFLCALIASALGQLACVQPREMPRLAAEVRRRSPHLILPASYGDALRELRAHRWPRHLDLGRR